MSIDKVGGFANGCIACIVIYILSNVAGLTTASEVQELIVECEQTLPRDQKCVLIAVPLNLKEGRLEIEK